jgi:hypothetical protein
MKTGLYANINAKRKRIAVGAPLAPGFLIFSPEPAAMRLRLALILAYRPVFISWPFS